jgi:hypothetical protein
MGLRGITIFYGVLPKPGVKSGMKYGFLMTGDKHEYLYLEIRN